MSEGRWFQRASAISARRAQCVEGEASQLAQRRKGDIERCFETIRDSRRHHRDPVHGDLHVGQILRWDGGYAVNDFDGNPVLPARGANGAEPAARDVAGMLQSLDHVGRVVLRRNGGRSPSRVIDWMAESQNSSSTVTART